MKVAVIGAGIGGLAAAIRLAVKGYDVTVYEKNPTPGGKMSQIEADGYRFDTGPSLFTLPELVEDLYELCGEKMSDHIAYTRLDVSCKYFFPEGDEFVFWHDRQKLADEIERTGIGDAEELFRRLDRSREIYDLGAPVFMFSNFHKVTNFNTPPYRRVATKLHKLDFFRTMHQANKADFSDGRFIKIFDRYATYNGSSPYLAPATLNMIAHLENNLGAAFPLRGMYSIVEGLYELALRQGVRFRFSDRVLHLQTHDGKVTGVGSTGGFSQYDIVVSDVDVKYLSRKLVKDYKLRKRLARSQPSSSALIYYWQVEKQFPELDLHNILFSTNYRKEFDSIFHRRQVPDDNTVYIFISSRIVPEDAPEGCENWFVMINSPSASGQAWDEVIAAARENIIAKINHTLKTDISQFIKGETVASPLTIEQATSSVGGALYGTSSNSPLSAFLRHPNHLGAYENLYFVGGSVHPGGGIPLCLASAGIVCGEIEKNYNQ